MLVIIDMVYNQLPIDTESIVFHKIHTVSISTMK